MLCEKKNQSDFLSCYYTPGGRYVQGMFGIHFLLIYYMLCECVGMLSACMRQLVNRDRLFSNPYVNRTLGLNKTGVLYSFQIN